MKTYVFLAEGFEEMEAIGTVDVLRRAGIDAQTVSITEKTMVKGAHGMPIEADKLLTNIDFSDAEALVLPGGMPGSNNLNDCELLKEALKEHYRQGKILAAICAAPLVLGGLGLLKGKKATCYPSFEQTLIGAEASSDAFVIDGNIITGKGPGLVFDFALAVVRALKGEAVSAEVAAGLLL